MTFNAQNSEKSLNSSLSLRLTNNNKKCRKILFLLPNVFPSPSPWDSFLVGFHSTVRWLFFVAVFVCVYLFLLHSFVRFFYIKKQKKLNIIMTFSIVRMLTSLHKVLFVLCFLVFFVLLNLLDFVSSFECVGNVQIFMEFPN